MAMSTGKKVLIGVAIVGALGLVTVYETYSYVVHGVYNKVKLLNNEADAQWGEVMNQYQRRSDMIPNLVAVVGRAAGHENGTLKAVIEARAKANSVQLTPEALKDPEAMKQFGKYQGDITTALSKLMMLTENYPNLKVNQNFLDLQTQVEGTENRITVARNRYITAVKKANEPIITFPGNFVAGFFQLKERPQFTVDSEEAKKAPKITDPTVMPEKK